MTDQKIAKLKAELEKKYDGLLKEAETAEQLQIAKLKADLEKEMNTQLEQMKKEIKKEMKKELKKELEQEMKVELSKLEVAFDAKVGILRNLVESKEEKINKLNREIGELQTSLSMTDTSVKEIVDKSKELGSSINFVNKNMDFVVKKTYDLEDRSRRQNLLFFNFDEEENETSEDVEKKIINFVNAKNLLGECEDSLYIDRAHRLGKKKPDKTRPIIIRCTYYRHKESIIMNRKNLASGSGNPGISIMEDYCKNTIDIHKELYENCKKAKSVVPNLKRFYINYKYATVIYQLGDTNSFIRKNYNLDNMKNNPNWFKLINE